MLFLFRFIINQNCIINRKLTSSLLAVAFSISTNAGIIYVPANSTDNTKTNSKTLAEIQKRIDSKAFLSLTPANIQETTGKKMTLAE